MRHDYVGFAQHPIELGNQLGVVVLVLSVAGVVRKGVGLYPLLVGPQDTKAEQEGVPLDPDGVGFVERPDCGQYRSRFDVEKRNAGGAQSRALEHAPDCQCTHNKSHDTRGDGEISRDVSPRHNGGGAGKYIADSRRIVGC